MPPKRKSTGATMIDGAVQTPSKRLRNSPNKAPGETEAASDAAMPKTGDKRKRGRPRKNPEAATPEPDNTPKRGRGRPPKIASPDVKRGRGRPHKEPEVETPKKVGRGQTGKSLPTNKTADIHSSTPKKDGRGRPRKSLPAEETPAVSTTPRGRGRPRKSVPSEEIPNTSTPKKGRGRPRKSLPADETPDVSSPKKGRGRPRKSLALDGTADSVESQPAPATKSEPKEDTGRSYWLMKAEPESRLEKGVDVKFSIDDLAAAKEPEPWDGVRNPVARNIMRDMKKGDYAFFYHSNCKVPGVVGIMEIVQEHSPDEAAFDPKHPYYDPKSSRDNPKWVVVHVEFRHKLKKQVTLADLKANGQAGKPLENLQTLKMSRLSVSKVTPEQWRYILELAGEDPQGSKV